MHLIFSYVPGFLIFLPRDGSLEPSHRIEEIWMGRSFNIEDLSSLQVFLMHVKPCNVEHWSLAKLMFQVDIESPFVIEETCGKLCDLVDNGLTVKLTFQSVFQAKSSSS